MSQVNFVVGDRWGDGHGKYKTFTYNSNVSGNEVAYALDEAIKHYGFDPKEQVVDEKITLKDYQKLRDLKIITDDDAEYYEKYCIEGDEVSVDTDYYVGMFIEMITSYRPDIELTTPNTTPTEIDLGGYGYASY